MDQWVNLQDFRQMEEPIFAGTIVRIYDQSVFSNTGFYDYILSFVYGNGEYLQMTCLSRGEGGNIVSVLKIKAGQGFTTIGEIKRMCEGYDKVLINVNPTIKIE